MISVLWGCFGYNNVDCRANGARPRHKETILVNAEQMPLYYGVIDFYRTEMARRYQLGNVRRFEAFAPISDADIGRLREYFLGRIYPPAKVRADQDVALEAMREVFRHPQRLAPLTGAALRSVWRLGRHAPAAITASVRTLEAYVEARYFESILLTNAVKAGVTPEETGDRDLMLRLLRTVPDREVKKLIDDLVGLFRILANIPMLRAGVQVMDNVIATMRKKTSHYSDLEIHGVEFATGMVEGGLELVEGHFDNAMIRSVVKGIENVEADWFDGVARDYVPLPLDKGPNPATNLA